MAPAGSSGIRAWPRSRPRSAAKIVTAPVEVVQTLAGTAADRSVPEALPQAVQCVVDPIDRRPVEQVQLGRVGEPTHAHAEQAYRIPRPGGVEQGERGVAYRGVSRR